MLFIAKVMACGFITFYSLQDAMPFLVRLTDDGGHADHGATGVTKRRFGARR